MKKRTVNATSIWYEDLGFKKNPFSIKPGENKTLFGLDEVVVQVKNNISDSQIILVQGSYGAGKTTFLRKIIKQFGGQKKVIYFACNRLHKDLNVDKLLYERFGLFTKVFKIKSKQMILLLDEAEHLQSKDIKTIYKYYNAGYFKSIVFVTHDKSLVPLSKTLVKKVAQNNYVFGELHEEQVVALVKERIDHPLLCAEVIVSIYQKDKRMRQFLRNCDTFMRHMTLLRRKTAKPKDVDKILSEHQV